MRSPRESPCVAALAYFDARVIAHTRRLARRREPGNVELAASRLAAADVESRFGAPLADIIRSATA